VNGTSSPADAVRVWRGYRLPQVGRADFLDKLGSIFLPATVLLQKPLGLAAYIPTIVVGDKPNMVPDEIALVFYETKDAYLNTRRAVAGRVYSALHDLIFSPQLSHSGFPDPLTDGFGVNQPYYLLNRPSDWQQGTWRVFVGLRRASQNWRTMHADLHAWLRGQCCERGPDLAIVNATEDYAIYWEHRSIPENNPRLSIGELGHLLQPLMMDEAKPLQVTDGPWADYAGLSLRGGETFCFQFARRETKKTESAGKL
jgi:hypothetical protein